MQQPPATPARPGLKPSPSYPLSGATPPPRPPVTVTPKRSPSAPNMPHQQGAPFKKPSAAPVPPAPYGGSPSPYSATPPQPVKTAPKKLQPNMIPPGLVVNKAPSIPSSSPTYGSTPPATYGSTPPSAPPIPPPNPFASRAAPAPITPPLSPSTSRAAPISPNPDNGEKKESFFNSLFGKKKAKERKCIHNNNTIPYSIIHIFLFIFTLLTIVFFSGDITIGTPFNVNHRVHVNYNTTTGFEVFIYSQSFLTFHNLHQPFLH